MIKVVYMLLFLLSLIIMGLLVIAFINGVQAISKGNNGTLEKVRLFLTVLGMIIDLAVAIVSVVCGSGILIINIGGTVNINNGSNDSLDPGEQIVLEDLDSGYDVVERFTVGWSDDIGGRTAYTWDEIGNGAIDGKIIFNSIIDDGVIGHEFNFVGARKNSGDNNETGNVWNANVIEVEEGCTYLVRLYGHNNGRFAEEDVAENVSIRFQITDTLRVTGNDIALDGFNSSNGYYGTAVYGYISVPDEEPSMYSDGVKFVSNRPFHLVYIPGTATFENNGIGKNGGCTLSDNIIWNFVQIGYSALDGRIPASYQYAFYSGIAVMPVFDD